MGILKLTLWERLSFELFCWKHLFMFYRVWFRDAAFANGYKVFLFWLDYRRKALEKLRHDLESVELE